VGTHTVLRSTGEPRPAVVTHSFDSADAAHRFFANEELKDAMVRARVDVSSHSIEFLDEIESETL